MSAEYGQMRRYPALEWWDASGISDHDKRLIRIGYFECLADQMKAKRALSTALVRGEIPTTVTETPIYVDWLRPG